MVRVRAKPLPRAMWCCVNTGYWRLITAGTAKTVASVIVLSDGSFGWFLGNMEVHRAKSLSAAKAAVRRAWRELSRAKHEREATGEGRE